MPLNRRKLMKLSAAGATALAMGVRPTSVLAAVDEIRDRALDYFLDLGFVELPPQELITGEAFNGGLRYDDTRSETVPYGWVSIQPAARIEDIPLRDRPDVLAGFNIIDLRHPPGAAPGTLFRTVMDFYLGDRKLEPERFLFVSTELFRPYIDAFEEARAGQFLERSLGEARAAGDGSGIFAPEGHPDAPDQMTVGLYYAPGDVDPGPAVAYPPSGYIELGEVEIPPLDGGPPEYEAAGLGVERLAMAEGADVPDFEATRLNLLRIIEDEAERTGKPLPPGYTMFASL